MTEKLKKTMELFEKQFRMPTLFSRFIEPPQPEQPKQDLNAPLTLNGVAMYPQRTWVGLTVDELIDLEHKHLSHENLTKAIKAKLKEKNGG